MSSVCSMDSEGMVNACKRKVTTKTAITTVPATDWMVAGQSPTEIFSLQDINNEVAMKPSLQKRLRENFGRPYGT